MVRQHEEAKDNGAEIHEVCRFD